MTTQAEDFSYYSFQEINKLAVWQKNEEGYMQIKVKNLGIIQEADIDLKPFTIFIGPNNSGKTWLAYTIADILSFNGYLQYLRAYVEDEDEEKYPSVEAALKKFIETGNSTFDLVQFIEESGETYFNNLARVVGKRLHDFMGTDHANFIDLKIDVHLTTQKAELLKQIQSTRINRSFPQQQPLIKAQKDVQERKIYFYLPGEDISNVSTIMPIEDANGGDVPSSLIPERVIKEFICSVIFQHIHRALYPSTYVFPTERTTFVTLPYGQSLDRELHSETHDADDEVSIKAMRRASGPISDFLSMMFGLYMLNRPVKIPARRKNRQIYEQLALLLETNILHGKVDLPLERTTSSREIFFCPMDFAKPVRLEMSVVSSMVKELSPLVLYLRFFAQKGDLLVIDEPEMNLHPNAQVQILEFLSLLVNAGIRVLLTTHSPYFLDHLSNLIKANTVVDKETASQMFFLKNKNAFLALQDVAVYLVENGKVQFAINEEGSLEWDTFTDVANKISEIYFSL